MAGDCLLQQRALNGLLWWPRCVPRSCWASASLSFALRIPWGLPPLSLGPCVSVGPRCSAPLPGVPAAVQHHTKPCLHARLSPALGTSWLAPWCTPPVLTLHVPVALCSAQGSAGSDTRDLVSCGGGEEMWGEEKNRAPQL